MSTNLKDSVFQRATGVLDPSGVPIIKPALRSIRGILLIAYEHREMESSASASRRSETFQCPVAPADSISEIRGNLLHTNIATEWVQTDEWHRVASFPHRRIR